MRSLHKIVKLAAGDENVRPLELVNDFSVLRPVHGLTESEVGEEPVHEESREEKEQKEASDIILKARYEAKDILRQAAEEAAQLKEHAEQEGYLAGFKCGREEGRKQSEAEGRAQWQQKIQDVEQDVTEFLESSSKVKDELLEQYLDDLKDIALAVAQKVINVSMKSSGDVIRRMIVSATDTVKKSQWAKIYVTKADARFLAQADSIFLKSLNRISDNVKIIPVDNGEDGTCIIELPNEVIDASINTQMDNIRNIIRNS